MLRNEGGWEVISWAMPITHFLVPFFFFLSRHIKRMRLSLMLGSLYVLLIHMIDVYWLTMPALGGHHPHLAISWVDFAAFFGVGGIFLGAFFFILSNNKLLPVGDPRLAESLGFQNY